MSKNISSILGMPDIPFAGLGIDMGLDMAYLEGEGEGDQQDQADDNESDLDDSGNDSEMVQSPENDADAGSGGNDDPDNQFAVPKNKPMMKKTGTNIPDLVSGGRKKSKLPGSLGIYDKIAEKFTKGYKVPVLFRSKRGGVRYRLSEIFYPSHPDKIRSNLEFNKECMKNKLLSLGKASAEEHKRKVKEALKNRTEILLKTIKESSIRLLLKEFLYFKSDLSLKANERILKDVKNERLVKRKLYYRNVKEIKNYIESSMRMKEFIEKKRKEQEEKEKAEEEKERLERLKGSQKKEIQKPNTLNVTFALRKENLILTTAERAKDINLICDHMNQKNNIFDMREESEYKELSEAKNIVTFLPVNPLNGAELLPKSVIQEIKSKADTSKIYPTAEVQPDAPIHLESSNFLKDVKYDNWNDEGTNRNRGNGATNNQRDRFDISGTLPSTSNMPPPPLREKDDDNDDLFGEDSPKAVKEEPDEDFFGGDSPGKKDDDSDEDFFDNAVGDSKDNEDNKDSNPFEANDEDDPFASAEPKEETNKKASAKIKREDDKDKVPVSDLFTKQTAIKTPDIIMQKEKERKFKYFGELDDCQSLFQIQYDSHRKMMKLLDAQKNSPIIIDKSGKETVQIHERVLAEEVSNKKLIESKIFNKLSMYKFRNKRMDGLSRLGPLVANKYSKMNSQNRVEKITLILESDKKRKDLNFTFEENMDKLYDTDIREIIHAIDSKRKKAYEDKHGHEMPEDERMTDISKQANIAQAKTDASSILDTADIDDISSIDSDTKEEEKKFRVHDGALGGTQNVMNQGTVDLLQHAKCFTFEYID